MKRILILLGLMAATSLGMQAENRTVTDTVDGKKRVIAPAKPTVTAPTATATTAAACNGWASTSAKTHRKPSSP